MNTHITDQKQASPSIPKRSILTNEDLANFTQSSTFNTFVAFIEQLSDSVRGKLLTDPLELSPALGKLSNLLDTIGSWAGDIDAAPEGKSRFGNAAFLIWYDRLENQAPKLLLDIIPEDYIEEVSVYLVHSFGNRKRIDYGTGHEAHFIAFLLCLVQLQILRLEDYTGAVLCVFWKYLMVMRTLQSKYWLEPAGSHGVWGLDDYNFLPFYFGASQLSSHQYLRPKSIHNQDIIEEFAKDYMYLQCIQFINSVT